MFTVQQYELLDFGAGRKLERFGDRILDRPCPAADSSTRQLSSIWSSAAAIFQRNSNPKSESTTANSIRGHWRSAQDLANIWTIAPLPKNQQIQFELKLTDFGHIGIFPEQAPHWNWIAQQVRAAFLSGNSSSNKSSEKNIRILNLFAYTGGSTLAAAVAGAAVTHVDAAKNIVAWARRNAELSALWETPIRWITDDTMKFVRREIKRGQRYDAVILDPPTYGHGVAGESWKLDQHLPELLSMCRDLTGPAPSLLLLTCHASQYDPSRLAELIFAAGFIRENANLEADDMWLATNSNRRLHSGYYARISHAQ